MSKICCIFNLGPLYRWPIYSLMAKELSCDFYLGDKTFTPIKTFDYQKLGGFRGYLRFKKRKHFYSLKGALQPIFNRNYKTYIVTGDRACLEIWVLLFWAIFTKKKVCLWCHGWHSDCSKRATFLNAIFYRLADHILLYGNDSMNYMLKRGIPVSKMTCIYNSLNYDKQLEYRKTTFPSDIFREHFRNDNPNLFYIGRLQNRKRLDIVIKAMHYLADMGIATNFTYVGERSDKIDIDSLIHSYHLEAVTWEFGPLYEERTKAELMTSADICVSPGNIGLTAMDSLMYGLPIITNDDFSSQMPEYEAIEEGKNGLFFKKGDEIDLANKIISWLSYAKTHTREEISQACYKPIDEKYNPHYQIKILKEVLFQ